MTSILCKQRLIKLRDSEDNSACADCGSKEPKADFISLNLGLFICINCSGMHRHLGTRFSVIKSLHLDTFDEEKCAAMESKGNKLAAMKWTYSVPDCWPEVQAKDFEDLTEQWIRAKYERQEFTEGSEDKQTYVKGAKYGYLFKKEKSGAKWNSRFFRISADTGEFSYFIKAEDSQAKQSVRLSQVNVMLLRECVTQRKHSMLITFPVNKNGYAKARFIYVYANNSFEIIDWFLTIRAARYRYLKPYLYEVQKSVVSQLLSRNYLKHGYLYKTGSKKGDEWRKRYVCVDMHRFLYFEKILEPECIGEVLVDNTCLVSEGTDGSHPTPPTKHVFLVHAQEAPKKRNPIFNFCAESRDEMDEWIVAFRTAIKCLDWFEPIKDQTGRMSLLSNISSRYSLVS